MNQVAKVKIMLMPEMLNKVIKLEVKLLLHVPLTELDIQALLNSQTDSLLAKLYLGLIGRETALLHNVSLLEARAASKREAQLKIKELRSLWKVKDRQRVLEKLSRENLKGNDYHTQLIKIINASQELLKHYLFKVREIQQEHVKHLLTEVFPQIEICKQLTPDEQEKLAQQVAELFYQRIYTPAKKEEIKKIVGTAMPVGETPTETKQIEKTAAQKFVLGTQIELIGLARETKIGKENTQFKDAEGKQVVPTAQFANKIYNDAENKNYSARYQQNLNVFIEGTEKTTETAKQLEIELEKAKNQFLKQVEQTEKDSEIIEELNNHKPHAEMKKSSQDIYSSSTTWAASHPNVSEVSNNDPTNAYKIMSNKYLEKENASENKTQQKETESQNEMQIALLEAFKYELKNKKSTCPSDLQFNIIKKLFPNDESSAESISQVIEEHLKPNFSHDARQLQLITKALKDAHQEVISQFNPNNTNSLKP